MLGYTYGGDDVPYEMSDYYDPMSEYEQFKVIDRALNGDLRGTVELTATDMELYNRLKGSYANEYRKATEFSYIPKARQDQVRAERTNPMVMTPPNQNIGFSSGYISTGPMYTNTSNPVLSGYASFNSPPTTPSYPYPNTYYNPGYGSYYGGYYGYYNRSNDYVDYGDPIMNYAMSKINDVGRMHYQGYFEPNSYYSYYQPPQPQMQTVNLNLPNEAIAYGGQLAAIQGSVIQQNIFNVSPADVATKSYEERTTIKVPMEFKQPSWGYYYYTDPYTRAAAIPPAYVNSQQYRDYCRKRQEMVEACYDSIYQSVCSYFGADYDKFKSTIKANYEQYGRQQYKHRHRYDNAIESEEEKSLDLAIDRNMRQVYSYYTSNPYGLTYNPADGWKYVMARLENNKNFKKMNEEFPSNQTAIEFLNEGYPKFAKRQAFEDFCRKARLGDMDYDSGKFRNVVDRDATNKYAHLGFKSVFNPITGQTETSITTPDSIAQKYNERRSRYIQEANKRGGLT